MFGGPGSGQRHLPDQRSGHLYPETAGLGGHADQRHRVLDQPHVNGEEYLGLSVKESDVCTGGVSSNYKE